MTQLPDGFVERTYIVVDAFKLDEYLREKFPNAKVIFASDFEMSNDSSKELNITSYPFDADEEEECDKLVAGESINSWGGPQFLMQRLCQQGVLPVGNYLVEVCW